MARRKQRTCKRSRRIQEKTTHLNLDTKPVTETITHPHGQERATPPPFGHGAYSTACTGYPYRRTTPTPMSVVNTCNPICVQLIAHAKPNTKHIVNTFPVPLALAYLSTLVTAHLRVVRSFLISKGLQPLSPSVQMLADRLEYNLLADRRLNARRPTRI